MKTKTIIRILLSSVIISVNTIVSNQQILEGFYKLALESKSQAYTEPSDRKYPDKEYDFIIVGAGTAGCVLANRLTENPRWKVLLVEAGGSENYLMDVPILVNYLQFTDANWNFKSQPSNGYCLGMKNGQCNMPRGKVMGGSSILNYMIVTRGNRKDYDNWAAAGNTGWSYDEVLPYFMKIEDYNVPGFEGDSRLHNRGGHLTVSTVPYKTRLVDAAIASGLQSGLNYVDYNGETQIGISHLQVSQRNGTRHASSRSYLHPIRYRNNLHVTKHSMVSRILIDPTSKRAYGVEFVKRGRKIKVLAKREVVLSAGAVMSPVVLMLSGVGPRKHLESVKVPVIQDLAVGYNLMDHVAHGGLTFIMDGPYGLNFRSTTTIPNANNFFNYHQGPFTVPGGCEGIAFYDTKRPGDPNGHPDIELLIQAGSISSDPATKLSFNIRKDIYDAVLAPTEKYETFTILPMLLLPKSKGRIMLKSNDYRVKPYIYPNYFAHKEDMDVMIKGIRLAINLTEQPALKRLGTRLHTIPVPPCAKYGFNTDSYWECVTRHFSLTIYHLSGTCKMGPVTDKSAVVDPRLRVHGITGLRVIDASIMPEVIAGHTDLPTYMIAEKGADLIKEDWGFGRGQNVPQDTSFYYTDYYGTDARNF